jgi:hypothetical protein
VLFVFGGASELDRSPASYTIALVAQEVIRRFIFDRLRVHYRQGKQKRVRNKGRYMDATLTAIELTGTVDEHHQLQLDTTLPIHGPKRVRVIVLYAPADEPDEVEWLRAAAHNPAFNDLNDPEEDIYSLTDGQPFHAEA